MLHSISWLVFFKVVLVIAAIYYLVIGVVFYRHEMTRTLWRKRSGL